MTTLPDRPNSALLVIDVQIGVMAGTVGRDDVIATVTGLVQRARAERVPVVWVQHNDENLPRDSEKWQYVEELDRGDAEPLVHKQFGDASEGTELGDVLAAGGNGRLVVVGAQTDECIRSTIHGAFTRGYDVTLVADGHTTEDLTEYGAPPPRAVIGHTNLYWRFQAAPGRQAEVVEAAEVRLA